MLIGFKVVEEVEDVIICFIVLEILGAEADRELEEEEEEDGKEEEEDGKEEEVVEEDEDDDKKAERTTDDAAFVTLLNASLLSEIDLLGTLSEEIG